MRSRLSLLLLLVSAAANAAVTGTIVGSDGTPLAGARVRAFAREPFSAIAARLLSATPDPTPLATAQSGTDGRFSIDTKGNAAVDVVVDAADRDPVALYAADGDDAGAVVLRAAEKTRRVKVAGAGDSARDKGAARRQAAPDRALLPRPFAPRPHRRRGDVRGAVHGRAAVR